ncbi:PadR family transcriptional regulator [Halosolutus amylolyticus]|uniref:PadR family transcriptional regulator n=1 Tax=Halosolutus amylolyticus TaxID=2932267 RepID=A0ABD5PUH4_9EURY|nr:PadR family transcriptional regulator [Halosolutus amylolyticus]
MVSKDSLSLTDQAVLLGVVALDRDGETPVQTPELRQVCKTRLDGVETVVGTLTEADVMRSLYRLEDEGIVEEIAGSETSPTGKGRPAYALNEGPDAIVDAVDDDLAEAMESSS